MALNKAQTSTGVKVVLVVLIIAFVASFISIGAGLFSGTGTTNTTSTDPLAQINAKYQPTVAAITSQLQSEPTSYTALVALGNTYFDWGVEMQQAGQTNPSAVGAEQPLWAAAKDAYRRALDIKGDEPGVNVDYAITLFYTGQTDEAIAVAVKVNKDAPDFAPAYFNLGIFYGALGQNDKAIAAFNKAIELDPEGQQTNLEFARQRIAELQASANASPTVETSPTP